MPAEALEKAEPALPLLATLVVLRQDNDDRWRPGRFGVRGSRFGVRRSQIHNSEFAIRNSLLSSVFCLLILNSPAYQCNSCKIMRHICPLAPAGPPLAAKAFAPASCSPSSLRRVIFSKIYKICEKVRLVILLRAIAISILSSSRAQKNVSESPGVRPKERIALSLPNSGAFSIP